MTVIAFDGTHVAADKGCWDGGHIHKVTKVRHVVIDGEKMIAVVSGCGTLARQMLRHLEDPENVPLPDYRGCHEIHADSTVALLFTKLGVIREVSAAGWMMTMEGHGPRGVFADGGGREMALGALLAGASAERAVDICIENSDYGGHGIDVLSIGDL